ncbi:hypothetical protein CQA49_08050 [Helicobacter sp. MIT 00-7814]|uniref:hypothetical protein n=1 Tax=unclassified Helicobacter TaxID=2593540 RepID=UPI000E1E35A0|nr:MULTISPECIES: hypothetical protein [unclassified Helicobacter]RDU51878.1 hypothetical protein CQA37_09200 [Helicobacter sp. MIT 99-10781]RDU52557.1 hypothetical protein CQA49_08050 [Helicobacter sp. MIT 00-7814]
MNIEDIQLLIQANPAMADNEYIKASLEKQAQNQQGATQTPNITSPKSENPVNLAMQNNNLLNAKSSFQAIKEEKQAKEQQASKEKINAYNELDKFLSTSTPSQPQDFTLPQAQVEQESAQMQGNYPFVKPDFRRNTGIDYFDKKQNITLLDALLAKELGVSLQKVDMNANINMQADVDLKQRQIALTEALKQNRETTNALNTISDNINYIAEASGLGNYLSRGLSNATGGYWNPSDANKNILANGELVLNYLAKEVYGSRPSNETMRYLRDLVDFKAKSPERIATDYAKILGLIANKLENNMNDLRARGFNVPQEMLDTYKGAKAQETKLLKMTKSKH